MGISIGPLALPKVAVSLYTINLHSTPHGEESRPAITAQPDGTATEETDRTWGLPCPSQRPLTKASTKVVEIQKKWGVSVSPGALCSKQS